MPASRSAKSRDPRPLAVLPVAGLPLFAPGDSLAELLLAALSAQGLELVQDDLVVVAQKAVSKCEGRHRSLDGIVPGDDARAFAARVGKPEAVVELILGETADVLRAAPNVLVVRHRSGHVAANAGIDFSNVSQPEDGALALLWPVDPDASAASLRAEILRLSGVRVAVVIADSLGRAWRLGTIGTAIGAAGIAALDDRRGETDLFGRPLIATIVGLADAAAAAASLVMGEGAEGVPAAILRGLAYTPVEAADDHGARALLRPVAEDLFL